MRKIICIALCTIGLISFSSCGSSKNCNYASKTKQLKKTEKNVVIIASENEVFNEN